MDMSLIISDTVCKTICWIVSNMEGEDNENLDRLYQRLMLIIYEW